MIAALIERNGGMPVRIEGMTRTRHEQINSPEYRDLRACLDAIAPRGLRCRADRAVSRLSSGLQ
jgi:hypothetical protein